ncbi:MAG: DedA family protein [Candidatus Lambdaproteobacteria bacterium]|nr:DedA family protein [Candidatus Lambdaproteobacteria bacterium]
MLDFLIENGSYALMLAFLLAAGLGLPLPEDIVLLAAGALVHREVTLLLPTVVVCVVGVIAGDLTIFLVARRLGARALEHRYYARLLPPHRRVRLERLLERHGGKYIFVARHLAGLRAGCFALAGMHRMPLRVFLFWDALALAFSGSAIMGLGYYFANHLEMALRYVARAQHTVLAVVALLVLAYIGMRLVRRWRSRPEPLPSQEPVPTPAPESRLTA